MWCGVAEDLPGITEYSSLQSLHAGQDPGLSSTFFFYPAPLPLSLPSTGEMGSYRMETAGATGRSFVSLTCLERRCRLQSCVKQEVCS